MDTTSIIFFKEPKINDSYALIAREKGYDPHFINVLDYSFVNQEKLREVLNNEDSYSGLIVTSQRAIEAIEKSQQLGSYPIWSKRVYVVGPATWDSISKLGFKNIGKKEETPGNAEMLGEEIIENYKDFKPLLYLVGDKSLYTLPNKLDGNNIPYEKILVYNTIAKSNVEEIVCSKMMNCMVNIPWVVFFSPSGVKAAYKYLVEPFHIACIGPTTRDYLLSIGGECDVMPTRPDPNELLTKIEEYDEKRKY